MAGPHHAARRSFSRIAWSTLIAGVAGAGVVVLLAYGGTGRLPAPIWLVGGAIDGMCVYLTCRGIAALFGSRLDDLPPALRIAALTLIFAVGGVAGWLLGTAIGSLLLGYPMPAPNRALLLFAGFMAAIAALGGFAFYGFELLADRVAESAVRLKEQEFAARELETAGALQRRLLPPAELAGEGWSVAARHLPARWVAGDFYDVVPGGDGALLLVVADVAGKGLAASLVMAAVKATIPFFTASGTVDEALGRLNERLISELSRREFVALAMARFEPATGRLVLANAGLPDPLLLRADAAPSELAVPGPRLPLGARRAVAYQSVTAGLEPGDRLLFLTDGLAEALSPDGEPIGYQRLHELVAATSGKGLAFLTGLFDAVAGASQEERTDDWTALLLTRP